jgi:RNA polymerase sigma-70 factor (ECF subfamily)
MSDAAVFRKIFDEHYGRVVRFFAARGFSNEESSDLAQETFLRVYKGLETFRGDSHLETWLFQIARNLSLNVLRDRGARKRSGTEIPLEDIGEPHQPGPGTPQQAMDPEGVPLDDLLTEERVRLVHQALAELPPRMRRCVLLRIEQELKYEEIAVVMQTSVDAVKALLYRARKQLQDQLGPYFSSLEF